MGGIVTDITDAVGLTDSGAGDRAAAMSIEAANMQAGYQQDALDYLKQKEELPSAIAGSALQKLAGTYGVPGYTDESVSQDAMVSQALGSQLFSALMGGQQSAEDAILRNASATGGIRSGNAQAALGQQASDLRNQALLQSYQEQKNIESNRLGGLSGLANLQSYAPQISQMTAGVGQTLAQGQVAGAQAQLAASQQQTQNLMGLGSLGLQAAAFSDARLKDNIKSTGEENGHATYSWTWNDLAAELGLYGSGFGVIADEVEKTNPEAVAESNGYKLVDYGMIGVNHG